MDVRVGGGRTTPGGGGGGGRTPRTPGTPGTPGRLRGSSAPVTPGTYQVLNKHLPLNCFAKERSDAERNLSEMGPKKILTVMFHIYGSAYRIILHQKPKPLTIFCAQMVEVTAMKPIAFKEIAFLLSMVIFSDF